MARKRWKKIDSEVAHPVYKNSIYRVEIKLDKEEMAAIRGLCELYDGTPAEVMKLIVFEFVAMKHILGQPPPGYTNHLKKDDRDRQPPQSSNWIWN